MPSRRTSFTLARSVRLSRPLRPVRVSGRLWRARAGAQSDPEGPVRSRPAGCLGHSQRTFQGRCPMIIPTLRTVHFGVAIVAGSLIALTGLTGSVLAFRNEIDAALNPSLWKVAPATSLRSLDEIVTAVEATGGPAPRMVLLPNRNDRAILVFLVGRGPADRWEVFVDPSTAKVLGRRRFGSAWIERVKQLHVELFAGRVGRMIVGAGGLCSLALGGTGLVLWWRTRPRSPSHFRRPAALDVHRRFGIIGLVPTTILAMTGALLIFRPYLAPILNHLTGPMPLELVVHSRGDRNLKPPSLDQIRDQALQAYPDSRVTRLYLPEGIRGTFAARLHLPEDANPHGNTAMLFDRYSGELIQEHSSRVTSVVQKILWYAPYPWHTGDALGLFGRGLVALAGMIPFALLTTGVMWWRSRRLELDQPGPMR